MAIPKKGSHVLDVDGRAYRWCVSTRAGTHRLRVGLAEEAGQLLTVEIPAAPDPWLIFSIQSAGVKGGKGLYPPGGMGEIKWALVQDAVRFAIGHGWNPAAKKRGPLTLVYRNHRFRPKTDSAEVRTPKPQDKRRRAT